MISVAAGAHLNGRISMDQGTIPSKSKTVKQDEEEQA